MSAGRNYLALVILIFLGLGTVCKSAAIAEESRFDNWQWNRPFTIGAMYYDGPCGPPAQLPAPAGAQPDMDLFRYAGLNMLNGVSWSNGGHERYPGVPAAHEAGIPYMILGAALQEDPEAAMNAFQSQVEFKSASPFAGAKRDGASN